MTDRELLERARRLPEALGEFYDRYESAVAAYFMRRTRSAPAAHELTAETFAEVVLQVHRGAEIHEPTGWLFTIAHHKLADYHRRGAVDRRARNRLGIPRHGADDEALERVEALLEEPRAELLLAELPEEQRAAVYARIVEEREYDEIAAAHATSEQVVRKRVSRGLAVLRRRLKERPGTKRLELRVDDGVAWTAVAYVMTNGIIATTTAPDMLHQQFSPTGGTSPAGIGAGPIKGVRLQAVRAGAKRHYLIAGLVDASVRTVTIQLGHRLAEARTSTGVMTIGKARVRLYAATFSGQLEHGPLGTVRPFALVRLADGTPRTVELARFCVTRRCGTVTPKLG